MHPICYVPPVEEEITSTVIVTDEDTSSGTTTSSLNDIFSSTSTEEFYDYEPEPEKSLSEIVDPPDLSLEDDPNFIDVVGVVTTEQAAEEIESILDKVTEEPEFDEKLIPQGDVSEVTDEFLETATP